MSALVDAARRAPGTPDVYFLLDAGGELLYVGKAAHLRRRLGDHAREPRVEGTRHAALVDRVAAVFWEETGNETEAALREADLIVAFGPALNAAIAGERLDRYLTVVAHRDGTATARLVGEIGGRRRTYGCFPHLAKGAASMPAKWSKTGMAALLRLLWVAGGGSRADRIPARIAGPSPPVEHLTPLDDDLAGLLHRFLSGQSRRLVPVLEAAVAGSAAVPAYMRPALAKDLAAANRLFDVAPRRLRELRLRHGLPPGPVGAARFVDCLAAEVREIVGEFLAPGLTGARTPLLGRYGPGRAR